jgi:hypothetical protein
MTAKEAQEAEVWVIENQRPVKTNLYDHVMASAEATTSPRGVENKLHIREHETPCNCVDDEGDHNEDCKNCYKGVQIEYCVYDWGFRGQYPRLIETFETEEEAANEIFERTEKYDFQNDVNRDTNYFYSQQEAERDICEGIASEHNLSMETAESIYKHMLIRDFIIAYREEVRREKHEREKERINTIAKQYAEMIPHIEGELFEDTVKRLSSAIGERIEKSVFWKAVKLVRNH